MPVKRKGVMRCSTQAAKGLRSFLQALADAAGLFTAGVSVAVRVSGPETGPNAVEPCIVGGKVTLPSPERCGGPVAFAHCWLHELQHANDYQDGRDEELDAEGMEAKAQRAEWLVAEDVILELWDAKK